MNKRIVKGCIWAVAVLLVVVMVFISNEARKEIVYLCGNFVPGVQESSVRRQLDTGNLLTYHKDQSTKGTRIVAQSVFNFYLRKCTVDFNKDGIVTDSRLE